MKILFVISQMTAGGAERQASIICNHWASSGHQVVLAKVHDDPSHYFLDDRIVQRTLEPGFSALGRAIVEVRPDVIVSFMDTTNVKVLMAAEGLAVPVIVSERSIPAALWMNNNTIRAIIFAILRRVYYRKAAALVSQTEAAAKWARKRTKCAVVIPNVVQPMAGIGRSSAGRNSRRVLAIGRFSQEKGHDVLIRAFARVAARLPEWQLKIVGEGPAHAHLSTLAAKLGIQNRVTLAPVTKDVLGEYLQADIFVLPSRFEGFPNTLIEAMQSGCAVIAADCPVAPREILSDGKNGLLFRNEDDEHLAELLSVLMHDPDRRSALGEGAVLAVKRYAPEVILSLWDGLIEACANIK